MECVSIPDIDVISNLQQEFLFSIWIMNLIEIEIGIGRPISSGA